MFTRLSSVFVPARMPGPEATRCSRGVRGISVPKSVAVALP
jgi:hypothetical protein